MRSVQQARRDAGLDVADRIALSLTGPADVLDAARAHEDLLASETLATSVRLTVGETVAVDVQRASA